jgi:hypothetical protein
MTETEYLGNRTIKEYTQIKCEHFILRLKERYGLDMTDEEYYSLNERIKASNNNKINREFQGVFKRKRGKSIGYIFFKETKVWVMYDTTYKILITTYPSNVDTDISQCIQSCFSKELRDIAHLIYNDMFKEQKKMSKLKFESDKEAFKHFALNTKYPSLHILLFRGKELDLFKLCHSIKAVLCLKSKTVQLTLKKKRT